MVNCNEPNCSLQATHCWWGLQDSGKLAFLISRTEFLYWKTDACVFNCHIIGKLACNGNLYLVCSMSATFWQVRFIRSFTSDIRVMMCEFLSSAFVYVHVQYYLWTSRCCLLYTSFLQSYFHCLQKFSLPFALVRCV